MALKEGAAGASGSGGSCRWVRTRQLPFVLRVPVTILRAHTRDMLIHRGAVGGGGVNWRTHPPRPNYPPTQNPRTQNQKKLPPGKNEILNRESKKRGPV